MPLYVFAGVFVCVVLTGFAVAPVALHREVSEAKEKLELALFNKHEREAALDALWHLRKEGVAHRNRRITDAEWPEWKAEFDAWHKAVLVKARVLSPNLENWLETLDQVKAPLLVESCHADHERFQRNMSEILARMQSFLEREIK